MLGDLYVLVNRLDHFLQEQKSDFMIKDSYLLETKFSQYENLDS